MNRFSKISLALCLANISASLLFSAEKAAVPQRTEVVRFEMASVIGVSSAVSQLGNCIAPNFQDTVALFTVALSVGGTAFGMDPTRPVSIVFYGVGEKPSMRITAYAVPNVRNIRESVSLWNMKFHARLEKGLVTLSTDDLVAAPPPVSPPGKKLDGSLLVMEALPDKMAFQFSSLNDEKNSHEILYSALDELMPGVEVLRFSFGTDGGDLVVKLSVQARKDSALDKYLSMPLPAKGTVEAYPGAKSILVFRLPPIESLYKHGEAFFFHHQNPMLPMLPSAISGFAVLSFDREFTQSAAKLIMDICPDKSAAIADAASCQGYTPYPDLYQLSRIPPLFCSMSGNRLSFYYTSTMEKDNLEQILKPVRLSLGADSPFAFYDLSSPDRPIARLLFRGNTAELVFRASPEWFSSLPPLTNVPLHKISPPTSRTETSLE